MLKYCKKFADKYEIKVGDVKKLIPNLGNKTNYAVLKYTSKPTYITHNFFDKDYVAIHEIKPALILNKPIYVGFTFLDLSGRCKISIISLLKKIWCWIVVYWHRQSYLWNKIRKCL